MSRPRASGRRLLVLRAGSPSGNNLIRSLKAGDGKLFIAGCHDDAFALKKSIADADYLVPERAERGFESALMRVIKAERIDLVIPNSDEDVLKIAGLAKRLPCRTFLPSAAAIARCQDKYDLTIFLRQRGFPTAETHPITRLTDVEKAFRRLSTHPLLWCRARKGSGSLGALPVNTPEQVRSWIKYWHDMRGVPARSFTLSEYLPGRDLMVQCLFKRGTPIMAKMFERLSYHTLNATPSGVSSTANVSKMVFDPDVLQMCIKAMRALDPKASCVFFADLKANAKGEVCFTEINAGRFSNMPTIHDLTGADNMCIAYVRAAFDERVALREPRDDPDPYYVTRTLDAEPIAFRGSSLFRDIRDVR